MNNWYIGVSMFKNNVNIYTGAGPEYILKIDVNVQKIGVIHRFIVKLDVIF